MGLWILLGSAVLLAVLVAAHTLTVELFRVQLPGKAGKDVKIVHLTDLHGRTRFLNGRLSELVNRECPDLLLITGDLTNKLGQLPEILAEIDRMQAPLGKWFVPGNHEREEVVGIGKRTIAGAEYRELLEAVDRSATVLDNEEALMDLAGGWLKLYGFDNSLSGYEDYRPGVEAASGAGAAAEPYTILLAHSPSIIRYIQRKQIPFDLLLTGHTHGGQIWPLGRLFGGFRSYHTGLKKTASSGYFFIGRGLGTSKIPVRLFCPPEIGVFTLQARDIAVDGRS